MNTALIDALAQRLDTALIDALAQRLDTVKLRLKLLNTETKACSVEAHAINTLLNVYLTSHIPSAPAPAPAPKSPRHDTRYNPHYDAALELIFEENNNTPLTVTELTEQLKQYTTQKLLVGSVYNILQRRVNNGLIAIVAQNGRSKHYALAQKTGEQNDPHTRTN